MPGGHLFSCRSGQAVVAVADVGGEVVAQLGEVAWYAMQLAQQVIQQVAVSQLSEDLLVPMAHPVHVVGMGRNMILILALPSTCYFPWFS